MAKFVKITGTSADDLLTASGLRSRLKGKQGDDTLNGGSASDRLEGGAGDDYITGGGGNDTIDGGKDVDVAMYGGGIAQYSFAFKNNGDLKGSVVDLVAQRDGSDSLKNVEYVLFRDALYDVRTGQTTFLNHAPVATDDSAVAAENTPIALQILANDFDADSDPLSPTIVTGPAHGLLSLGAGGVYTYAPGPNFSGDDSFTYVVSDGSATSNLATVAIHVQPVVSGKAVDGYVRGATVFADANMNGVLDAGEVRTTTGLGGEYTLVGGSGPLVMTGGTDIATGLAFTGLLQAPTGSQVISPLTTLAEALVATGLTIDDAENAVRNAFGIGPGVELSTLDPIAETLAGNPLGSALFTAGSAVLNTVTMLASLIDGSSDSIDFNAAFAQAVSAMAARIAELGEGEVLGLATPATIETLISSTGIDFDPQLAEGALRIIVASNELLAQKASQAGADGVSLLVAASQVSEVAQGSAAAALHAAAADPAAIADAVSAFTGAGLQAAYTDAAHAIGDIDGPAANHAPVAALSRSIVPDLNFAADGVVQTDMSVQDDLQTMVVQADGKILVAGVTHDDLGAIDRVLILRYNTDGTLDNGFGTGGVVDRAAGPIDNPELDLALQADGRLLLTSSVYDPAGADIGVFRYMLDGSPDLTFGTDGSVVTDLRNTERASAVAVDNDGRIVVAGSTLSSPGTLSSTSEFAVLRYLPDGTLDSTFDSDGVATLKLARFHNHLNAIGFQGDDIIVAGHANPNRTFDDHATVLRYTESGALDTSFGTGGAVMTFTGRGDGVRDLAVQGDGSIITVNQWMNFRPPMLGPREEFAVERFDSQGTLEQSALTVVSQHTVVDSFRGTTTVYNDDSSAYSLQVQSDGKILVAGSTRLESGHDVLAFVRYNGDLTVDVSFADNGRLVTGAPLSLSGPVASSMTPQGQLVIGATASNESDDFTLMRYVSAHHAVAQEETAFSFASGALFVDPDGDALTYDAILSNGAPLPAWLSIDGSSGALTGTPHSADAAVLDLTIRATDSHGAFASDQLRLEVMVSDALAGGAVLL